MWPFTQRKKIHKTRPVQAFRTDPQRNRTVVQESTSDNSTSDFVLGVAGIPIPSAAGLTGYAIHSMNESANAKEPESCSSTTSESSSSTSDSSSSSSCGTD